MLEYSTNGGSTWIDAGGLIDAGQALQRHDRERLRQSSRRPLRHSSRSSYGYTGTRLEPRVAGRPEREVPLPDRHGHHRRFPRLDGRQLRHLLLHGSPRRSPMTRWSVSTTKIQHGPHQRAAHTNRRHSRRHGADRVHSWTDPTAHGGFDGQSRAHHRPANRSFAGLRSIRTHGADLHECVSRRREGENESTSRSSGPRSSPSSEP